MLVEEHLHSTTNARLPGRRRPLDDKRPGPGKGASTRRQTPRSREGAVTTAYGTNESRAGWSGALALVHCAFLPRLRVTPSPSEHPCARPLPPTTASPLGMPQHTEGQVPRTARRSKGHHSPLPRRHLPTRPPSSQAPASRRLGGNRTLVFVTLVSPSQERGVGVPHLHKGPDSNDSSGGGVEWGRC